MAAVEYPNEPASLLRTYRDLLVVVGITFLGSLLTAAVFYQLLGVGPFLLAYVPGAPYDAALFGVIIGMTFGAVPGLLQSAWGEHEEPDEAEEPQPITDAHLRLFGLLGIVAIIDLSVMLLVALVAGAQFGPTAAVIVPLADKVAGHRLGYSFGLATVWASLKVVQTLGFARSLTLADVDIWNFRGRRRHYS